MGEEQSEELMVVKGHSLCSCCRRRLEELQQEGLRSREEAELLQREVTAAKYHTAVTLSEASTEGSPPPQNSRHRQEVLDLSTRNLELSSSNAELSARLHDQQGAVQTLEERLEEELSTQRDQVPVQTTFSNFLLDFLLHLPFLSLCCSLAVWRRRRRSLAAW